MNDRLLRLVVKYGVGEEKEVKVPRDISVRNLKGLVGRACGVKGRRWRLEKGGEEMDLGKGVEWFDLSGGDVIEVVV